jgi:hypothetical protein
MNIDAFIADGKGHGTVYRSLNTLRIFPLLFRHSFKISTLSLYQLMQSTNRLVTAVIISGWTIVRIYAKCNASSIIAAPVFVGGVGDSGTRGIRSLLELLGLRVCKPSGLAGDDASIQKATHHLLYHSVFPFVEDLTAQSRLELVLDDPMERVTGALHRDHRPHHGYHHYSPNPHLFPGSAVLREGDPFQRFAAALVSHLGFMESPRWGSDASTRLCDAVATSRACALSTPSRMDLDLRAAMGHSLPLLWYCHCTPHFRFNFKQNLLKLSSANCIKRSLNEYSLDSLMESAHHKCFFFFVKNKQ